jgi:hypothetical protein
MNLDIPQAWMVEAVKSPYDLDNIYLKEVRIETKRMHYAPQDVLLIQCVCICYYLGHVVIACIYITGGPICNWKF